MTGRWVDPSLVVHDGDVLHLRGASCTSCGATTFPAQDVCPRCVDGDMAIRQLPRTGTLWTWTIQCFEPKPPYRAAGPFEPYGIGYVDLEGVVRVEARLTISDPQELRIGDPYRLTTIIHAYDADVPVRTFAFEPVS